MISWININIIKVTNKKITTRQAMQSNELTLPSDVLSMLAEKSINNDHHVSDEESTINHHLVN